MAFLLFATRAGCDAFEPRQPLAARTLLLRVAVGFASLVLPASAAHAAAATTLHYQLGGVMSGPIDLTLDLDSGRFIIAETSSRQATTMLRRSGRLDARTALRLRRQAEAAVGKGLETDSCRRATMPRPPIADAIRVLTITIRGRSTTAPDSILCWSKAAEDVASAAYGSVRAATAGKVSSNGHALYPAILSPSIAAPRLS